GKTFLGVTAAAPANLGIRRGQISYRSDLVVLSFLGSFFPAQQARAYAHRIKRTAGNDLHHGGWRQRRRRVALLPVIETRLERQPRTENRNGNLRAGGSARHIGIARGSVVAGSSADWTGCGGPPGLVVQPLYACFGHVSQARSCVSRGSRRIRRRGWRNAHR